MTYLALADIKTYLMAGGVIAHDTDDALLTACSTRAQAFIESPAGANGLFEVLADTTRSFDAVGDIRGRRLKLDYPCLAVTTLTNGDGAVIAASEYVTEPVNYTPFYAVRLKSASTTAWTYTTSPENAISLAGKWGLSLTPNDAIKQAALRLAVWLYRQKDSSADVDRPLLTSDGAVILPMAIPNDVMALLRPYRERRT